MSIGIERLCKLIYISDHAIIHGGVFPIYNNLTQQGPPSR